MWRAIVLFGGFLASGCALEPVVCAPCEGACPSGLTCSAGHCQVPGFLCPKSRPLEAVDAELDAAPDALPDALPDAGPDAGPDLGPDATPPPVCPNPTVQWTRLWDYGESEGPFPRTGSGGVFVGEAFYVFGGVFNREYPEVPPNTTNGELWRYAEGTWTQRPTCPEARGYQGMVPASDGFVVLSSASAVRAHWRYIEGEPGRWESIRNQGEALPLDYNQFGVGGDAEGAFAFGGGGAEVGGISPPPFFYIRALAGTHLPIRTGNPGAELDPHIRLGAALDPSRRQFYMIGGALPPNGWTAIRRARLYDAPSNTVRDLPEADSPPALDSMVVAWLPAVDLLFVFGGQDPGNYATDGVWLYQPSHDRWLPPSSGGGPTARMSPTHAVAPDGRSVYIYGGTGSRALGYPGLGDLWRAEVVCQ